MDDFNQPEVGTPWKEQRKRLKEWKWKDIEVGNYEDHTVMLIISWLITLGFFLMPYIDIVLDGILIHQIYSERENLQDSIVKNETGSFCSPNATRSTIVFTAREETILPCHFVETSLLVLLAAYAFFSLLGFIFTMIDLNTARRIIKSDDVSDSMIEPVAYQVHSIRWYSHFCFFKRVEREQTLTDKAIIFVYQVLVKGKQLIPDVAQFIMALIFSFIINELQTNDLTSRSSVTTILKLLLLVFRLLSLLGCLIAYPFMRGCYVKSRLQQYTSFRFEKVIDLVLWSQKNKFSNLSTGTATVGVAEMDNMPSSPPASLPQGPRQPSPFAPNEPNPAYPSYNASYSGYPAVNPIPPPQAYPNANPYPQYPAYPGYDPNYPNQYPPTY